MDLDNCLRGKLPPVGVSVWVRIRVRIRVEGQFSSGAIALEPDIHVNHYLNKRTHEAKII